MICPVASHSGVQEEYHSKVQDPQLQMLGSGIEKLFFNWEGFGVIALWRSLENEYNTNQIYKGRKVTPKCESEARV